MDPINPNTVAFGGEELTVPHFDGTTETVKVRLFRLADIPDYLRRLEDEEALAELACTKEAGWGATLHPDALMDICEKVHDLNFQRARRWGERRAELNESLLPLAQKCIAVRSVLESSASTPRSSSVAP